MQNNNPQQDGTGASVPKVVTADSVQAEEVPTIPLGSLQTINALQPEVSIHPVAPTPAASPPAPLVVQPSEYHLSLVEWLKVWRDGIRPSYLALSLLPAILGSVLAWTQSISQQTPFGHFHPLRFIATLISISLLQIGANLINDYYDYLSGVDTSNQFGPGGLIQQGFVKPSQVLSSGLAALALGAVCGILVAFSGGLLVFVFGLIGLLCAYFYSAFSQSLSRRALGEIAGFLIFGPLITLGAYMVQTGRLDRSVLLYSIPLGLLATSVIHLNNMRDIESDSHANKYTLAVLLGLGWSRAFGLLLFAAVYAITLALSVPHNTPHLILITLWTLPTLVIVISGMLRTDTPAGFDLTMRQAIMLEILFVLFLLIALIVTAIFPVLPHIPAIVLPI